MPLKGARYAMVTTKTERKPSRVLLAYLAGFLDGEGSVSLWHYRDPKGNRLTPKHRLVISCVNTRREPLALFQETFGGYLRLYARKNPKHRPLWRWEVGATRGVDVLTRLQPYLLIKSTQAALALEYQKGVKNRYGCRGVPPNEQRRRVALITTIRGLNRRGTDGGIVNAGNQQSPISIHAGSGAR